MAKYLKRYNYIGNKHTKFFSPQTGYYITRHKLIGYILINSLLCLGLSGISVVFLVIWVFPVNLGTRVWNPLARTPTPDPSRKWRSDLMQQLEHEN